MKWKKVYGWPYYISEYGHVRHEDGFFIKIRVDKGRYHKVCLCKAPRPIELVRKYCFVHRLVLAAFVGSRPSNKHFAAHYDGDKGNNHYTNLRWATAKQNAQDNIRLGTTCRGERHPKTPLTEKDVLAIRADKRSQEKLAAAYGVRLFAIQNILHRRSWTHI